MSITPDRTIGSIVADDFRAAAVFTAHGIDFCCKGGRTLQDVCDAKGIEVATIDREIAEALRHGQPTADDPATWTLTHLAEHVERVHHGYVNERTPVIQQYLAKLCKVHGGEHPELHDIAREFDGCAGAMAAHMKKEELVLFPFIKRLELAQREGSTPPTPHFGTVENPVNMMMHEHDEEGERFRRIATLTSGYTPPPQGCNTYRAAFALLQEFEQDLHRHIHLENNILFPKAVALEAELRHATA
ncbi:MAG: iron-sulfur cluster repair di-iron protein [Flavobacteriales bacterium]|jgi:regulator of cell morphogenesis and NO signaling|nr:iron-sulfur cluster repair di-iron protein [Flavobacteriales bacterium]